MLIDYRKVFAILLFSVFLSGKVNAGEHVNYNYTEHYYYNYNNFYHHFDLHTCENGLISGIHSKKRDTVCTDQGANLVLSDMGWNPTFGEYFNSKSKASVRMTLRNGMHACPRGTAMNAIEVRKRDFGGYQFENGFLCVPADLTGEPFLSGAGYPKLSRFGMHACPIGAVMTGWHEDKNQLECTWLN